MSELEPKTVLVTGGAKRLGLAISERLRRGGWRVLTSSHRPSAGADIVADLSEPLGAARLYAAALDILGGKPPYALVNNAGLFVGSDAAVDSVNFEAPQKLTIMMSGRESGRGTVVNILDAALLHPAAQKTSLASPRYAATKRKLMAYTKKAAMMFAGNLRVNAVAPGSVLAPVGVGEKAGDSLLGRPKPEDVADAVAFLLEAESTTGVIIPVDGGQHLLNDCAASPLMVQYTA